MTVLVDDPDLPRPPREREPRLAPPPAAPPPSDECADLPPTSAVDDRFLLATAAFLHIAARGAGFGAGSSFADGAWSTSEGPKPGGWFSRLLDLYTSTAVRGAGMANPTFLPSVLWTAASFVSVSLGFLIAGGT